MNRRGFLATAAALAAAAHGRAAAAKRPRIGIVLPVEPRHVEERVGMMDIYLAAFADGLRERGWVPGKSIEIVVRGGAPHSDHGPAIDALRREGVDLLVLWGNVPAQHASRFAADIPVVAFLHFGVASGVIQSLARPGTNVTGVAIEQPGVAAKRLALLKEAAGVRRAVRFYYGGEYRIGKLGEILPEYGEAAGRLGLEVFPLWVKTPDEIGRAMSEIFARNPGTGITTQLGPNVPFWPVFMEAVARHRVPVIYDRGQSVASGGLMSYGDDWAHRFRSLAHAADRILRGAKPADIPVEQPAVFEMAVNLDAARAIGLVLPPAVMLQASRVYGR